jgi:ABC-type uncharacterized transport system ATPase subunit
MGNECTLLYRDFSISIPSLVICTQLNTCQQGVLIFNKTLRKMRQLYSEVSYVVENLNTNYELERNVCEIYSTTYLEAYSHVWQTLCFV